MASAYSKGVAQILCGTVMWGIGYPIWKQLAMVVPPLLLTMMSFLIAAVLMVPAYRLDLAALIPKLKRYWPVLVALGVSGGVFGTGLLCFALTKIDSGVTAFLEKLQPVFALLAARLFLSEVITRRSIGYMCLALLFSFVIANPHPLSFQIKSDALLGIMAAIGASFFYGVNTVMSKYAVSNDIQPRELAFFRMALGGLFAIPFFLLLPGPGVESVDFNLRLGSLLLAEVVISLVLGFDLFLTGLRTVPASIATFLELATPLVALFLGITILGESATTSQLLAIPPFLYCIIQISSRPAGSEIVASRSGL